MYRRNFPDDPGYMPNMGDSHTRVTYRRNPNFLERVGNSLVGVLVGLAMLLAASALLFWNEGRAVQTAQSLDEGLAMAVSLDDIYQPYDENNGKLVHISGALKTEQAVEDPTFKVSVFCAKLKRNVEMYQWVEHENRREYNEGGETRVETTYSYSLEWRSELIRSQSFDSPGHNNPTSMIFKSETYTANRINVGGFELSKGLIDRISTFRRLDSQYIKKHPTDPNIKLYDGIFYHSLDPARPQVGDIRVTFEYAGRSDFSELGDPEQVSIVARQLGNKLLKFSTIAGNDLEILHYGKLSAKEIFAKEHQQNTFMTWGIRFAGWLIMFFGFVCLTSILTTLVDWLPIIRDLVAAGVGIMNLAFSISLSLTVIALGWIRYRPLFGMAVLAMALTPFIMSKMRSRQSRHY